MLIANWDIVQQLAKFGYVCGMQCINCDEEVRELTRRRDKLSLLSSVFMGLLPVQLILIVD